MSDVPMSEFLGHDPMCPLHMAPSPPTGTCTCLLIEAVRTDQIGRMNETWQPTLRAAELRGEKRGLEQAFEAVKSCISWDDELDDDGQPRQVIWQDTALMRIRQLIADTATL